MAAPMGPSPTCITRIVMLGKSTNVTFGRALDALALCDRDGVVHNTVWVTEVRSACCRRAIRPQRELRHRCAARAARPPAAWPRAHPVAEHQCKSDRRAAVPSLLERVAPRGINLAAGAPPC